MRRTSLLALCSAALLAACDLPTGGGDVPGIDYAADQSSYTRGEAITTVLTNTSETDIGYNLCFSELERRSGGGWRRVERSVGIGCIAPLYTLHPREATTFRELAGAVPGPGVYRLRTTVHVRMSEQVSIATDPFTVRE